MGVLPELPLEHNYLGGLPELPTDHAHKTTHPPIVDRTRSPDLDLNLGATELRLGLPGSEPPPPEREFLAATKDADGSCPVGSFSKNSASGAKRGFSEAIDLRRSGKWVFDDVVRPDHNRTEAAALNGSASGSQVPASARAVSGTDGTEKKAQSPSAPRQASKAQVVGWPPIRSFRKNTMGTVSPPVSKTNNNVEKVNPKQEAGCLYVKVSMDGAPYLRKINLKIYRSYTELSTALEKMFSCFTIGQYGYHGVSERDGRLSKSRLMDLLRGSEYVLIYEDKDGDWMLVGDVPWNMFTSSCRRLRITKSSEAIGLAKDSRSKNGTEAEPKK